YPVKIYATTHEGLFSFYRNHRIVVLTGFVALFSAVAITNLYFGIYQRGEIPRTVLPYGLGGIYSWLLIFGLASFSAVILNLEFTLNKKTTYPAAILCLLEGFLTNVSLLSRGMILNTGALVYGVIRSMKLTAIRSSYRFLGTTSLIFIVLFGSSVILVDHLRFWGSILDTNSGISSGIRIDLGANESGKSTLFLDRWVGIEGVMAVSSYPEQGWALWDEAWKETYSKKMSFYDTNLITSPYRHKDLTKHHYISLPGIIAFCFYPGSFPFLFGCMFVLGAIAAAIEIAVFKLGGGNIILCALLAQVVAYRYASFGYLPSQSYLLFGALFLNLFIIYLSNRMLLHWYRKKDS
ncbi:MAG: hypothetical protein Q7J78_04335, partial [Clostridiales bacterium]|nr:hypothetical protein [Clostridiales bacterium]